MNAFGHICRVDNFCVFPFAFVNPSSFRKRSIQTDENLHPVCDSKFDGAASSANVPTPFTKIKSSIAQQ